MPVTSLRVSAFVTFPFPRSFFFFVSGLPPARDSEFPAGLRARCGGPRALRCGDCRPLSIGYRPPGVDFRPFSTAFRARPPPFDCRLPIRIAPLLFWILFVRLFRSNSSPALLDSVRTFSPRRMAPLRGTLDVLRWWMRPISKLLPDSGRSLDLRKSFQSKICIKIFAKNVKVDYFDSAESENRGPEI